MFDLETYELMVATMTAMADEIETWTEEQHVQNADAIKLHDGIVECLNENNRCHDCGERMQIPVKDGLHCPRCGEWA